MKEIYFDSHILNNRLFGANTDSAIDKESYFDSHPNEGELEGVTFHLLCVLTKVGRICCQGIRLKYQSELPVLKLNTFVVLLEDSANPQG